MTTSAIFYPIIITVLALLLIGVLSKKEDHSALLLGGMGMLLTVIGVILLSSPLTFQSGVEEMQDNSTGLSTTSYSYMPASTPLNTAFALTLTIIGIMSTWLAYMERKKRREATTDDGLGGFDD